MPVFFGIGSMPIAVFEVDPKIFDWLVLQLCDGAIKYGLRKFAARESQAMCERCRVRRVVANQVKRERSQSGGSVGLEKLRAAINYMDRLPVRRCQNHRVMSTFCSV